MDSNFSRRKFLGVLGGLGVTVAAGSTLAACTTTKTSDQKEQKRILADLRATKKYKEKKIECGDNFFSPKETSVEAGTIVIWTNIGNSIHDVVTDDSHSHSESESDTTNDGHMDDFSSDTLRSDDIHVALFDVPGKYFYHCHFHGGPQRGQWGSITVKSVENP